MNGGLQKNGMTKSTAKTNPIHTWTRLLPRGSGMGVRRSKMGVELVKVGLLVALKTCAVYHENLAGNRVSQSIRYFFAVCP